jgi:prophage regulatory protein
MASGNFPKAIPLGERTVGWLESEIDSWIESRVRARDRALS